MTTQLDGRRHTFALCSSSTWIVVASLNLVEPRLSRDAAQYRRVNKISRQQC
jgi:hypothetical protein